MSIVYIAFIECALKPSESWSLAGEEMEKYPHISGDVYYSQNNDAEIGLVDIKEDRRYFRFGKSNTSIRMLNNVLIFEDESAEEITVDESKQFFRGNIT